MARELSDAEVFGSSVQELSDDEVFGAPAFRPPPGYPTASPAPRTLRERFQDNFEEGRRGSLTGAAADAYGANLPGSRGAFIREKNRDAADAYALRSGADPWYRAPGGIVGKAEAGAATLGGAIAGGLFSPESIIGPGKTAIGRIVGNAAVNAAVDVPVQGLQNQAGTHEGYDPVRTAAAAGTGALVQTGAEGVGAVARRVASAVADRLHSKPELSDAEVFGAEAPASPAKPAPAAGGEVSDAEVFGRAMPSANAAPSPDVWGRLIARESGGDQSAVSPKGAFGVAQLMPATAEEMARKLGDPSLAAKARTDAAVNERLGRAYFDQLLDRYDGDHVLASAAYNAGPGRVDGWIRKFGRPDDIGAEVWASQIPIKETRDYVKHVALGSGDAAAVRTPRMPQEASAEPEATPAPELRAESELTPLQAEEAAFRDQYARTREAGAEIRREPATGELSDAEVFARPEARAAQTNELLSGPRAEPLNALARAADETPVNRLAALSDMRPPMAAADPPNAFARRAAVDLSAYGDAIKAARPAGNVVGARRSAARRVGEGSPEYARQTVSQLADRLRKSLSLTHRQGRLTLKGGAVGEFDPKSGVIRTKAARDAIDHLAHEAGHRLQFMRTGALAPAIAAHAHELEPMAYAGANPAHRLEEGFAEFFKAYVLNPNEAKLRAPNFHDRFEAALAQDLPHVARDLKAIQQAYQSLLEGAALDVAASSVAYTGRPGVAGQVRQAFADKGLKGVLLDIADEAYRGVFDAKHPFNVWLRRVQKLSQENTGKRLAIDAAKDPYVLARLADHSFAMGQSDLEHGVTPYDGADPEGPSMKDINKAAFGDRQPSKEEDAQFASYLIARRMVHEWDRFYRGELERQPDKVEQDKRFHETVIADAERLHPNWKQAAEMATDWNRRQWKLEYDAGLITQATYEAGLRDHPDYVPLMRDMSDRAAPGVGGKARGVGQFAGGAKAFEGSQRDIIHPLVSMARRAFELRAAIARNEVVRAMWDAAEKAGENHGELIEQLPAKQWEVIKVDAMEALDAVAKAMGMSDRDRSTFSVFQSAELEGTIQAELFRQHEFSPRKDEAVVVMWKGGQKTPLMLPDGKLGRDLFTALSGLTKDTRTLWTEVAGGAAQALRLGITGVPEFAVKTTIRDQFAAAVLTDVGFIPYVDSAKGLVGELGHSKAAKRYQAAGGLKGGVNVAALRKPFPRTDTDAKAQLQRYQGRHIGGQLWSKVLHAVDVGDTATRLAVFQKAEQRALKRGATPKEAAIEARHIAADFFDPSRHGAWPAVAQLARIVPFFNSGLQGPDVLVRTIRHAFEKPETLRDKAKFKRAWWTLSLLGASAALGGVVAALHHDDPDYQNLNDQLRATNLPLFKRANGEWVLYPKAFELGMPSNLVERATVWWLDKDPTTLKRIGRDLMATVVPSANAPILALPFEVARNRDYLGRPIVPDHLRGTVEPRLQVKDYTSDTAKLLAGNRISPALLEHYVRGLFGSAGRDLLSVSDAAIRKARGEPAMARRAPDEYMLRGYVRRTARGSDSEANFWKLAAKDGPLEKARNSLRLLAREGDDAKVKAYLDGLSPGARSYAMAHVLLGGKMAKAHPIARGRIVLSVIGDMRTENRKGVLVGANNRPIALSPADRRRLDDALDDLALVEAQNAQIAAGVPGWTQREFINRRDAIDRIHDIAPPVAQALNLRLAQSGALPIRSASKVWGAATDVIDNLTPQKLKALLMKSRMDSGPERQAEVRRLGAANALAGQAPRNALAR